MSTLSFNHSLAHGAAPRSNWITRAASVLTAEWQARKAVRTVDSLSDEMLHDIGISRGEIDAAVRNGRR